MDKKEVKLICLSCRVEMILTVQQWEKHRNDKCMCGGTLERRN